MIFYAPDTHTSMCLSLGRKCSFFGKNWRTWFSYEIDPFALLPANCGFKMGTKFCTENHLKTNARVVLTIFIGKLYVLV